MNKHLKIRTKTSKGTVLTQWSDDEWNVAGWETSWSSFDIPGLPIARLAGVTKGGKTWEEAGRNHLAMCQKMMES